VKGRITHRAFAIGACALLTLAARGVAGEPPKAPVNPVQVAIDELAAPSADVRAAAAARLGALWPDAARAVPLLVIALEDEDAGVRGRASEAIRALAERALPVVAANVSTLAERDDFLNTVRLLGDAATPTDMALGLRGTHPLALRGSAPVRRGLTALAALRFKAREEPQRALRGAREALAAADAAFDQHGAAHLDLAAAGLVLRGLDVARILGVQEGLSLSVEVRAGLVRDARVADSLVSECALRLLDAARAAGNDVTTVALAVVGLPDRSVETPGSLLARSGAAPAALEPLLSKTAGLGFLVPSLVESGSWSLLDAMLANGDFESRTAAARALLLSERADEKAAEALTTHLDWHSPSIEEPFGPFDPRDGRARDLVRVLERFGRAHRKRLEELTRTAPAPQRLALADALAHATSPSENGARIVAAARDAERAHEKGAEGDSSWPWTPALEDALLWTSENAEVPARVRRILRNPSVDVAGLQRATAELHRVGPPAAELAPDLGAALVRALSREAPSALSGDGRPTLSGILACGDAVDDRFEAARLLLDALGALGPAAKDAAASIEAAGSGSVDARIRHVTARALRRIAAK
jgi:hypothetical protein